MDKKIFEETIKPNQESKINRGSGHYSNAGMINNDNGPTSKTKEQSDNEYNSNVLSKSASNTGMTSNTSVATSKSKGHLDNEYDPNVLSSSVSNTDMSTSMTSNTNYVTLDEEGKLKIRLTANKTTN